MLLVPLVFIAGARDPFHLPKLMLAEGLGLASLFFFSFLLWRVNRLDLGRNATLLAVTPLVLIASLTLLTTVSPPHTREAVIGLWIGSACLVGWASALSSRHLERSLRLLAVPALLLATLAVLQHYRIYQPFRLDGDVQGRMAVTSLAGNVGDLGAFLVLPSLIAQWAAWKASGPRRWLWALGAAAMLFGIAVTQTLAAVVGVLVGTALLWALLAPGRYLLPAAGAGAVIVALALIAVEPLRSRALEKGSQLVAGNLDAALTGRLDGWKTAGWMLREQPLLGVGHGAYLPGFVPAKLELLDRGLTFFPGQPFSVFANPHNEILEVGAELGVLGLLALAWGSWWLLRQLRILARRSYPEAALAWAGVAALLVVALVHFPFRLALTGYPSLLFLAWSFRRAAETEQGG